VSIERRSFTLSDTLSDIKTVTDVPEIVNPWLFVLTNLYRNQQLKQLDQLLTLKILHDTIRLGIEISDTQRPMVDTPL
jgi:hypothetical protein